MKRTRMITCCGKQTHSESSEFNADQRPRQPPTSHQIRGGGAENRGAHNKYAGESHHHHNHHQLQQIIASETTESAVVKSRRSGTATDVCDVRDLTVTLPGMVVGNGKNNSHAVTTGSSRCSSGQTCASSSNGGQSHDKMHISGSDKVISKKDKARQKFHSNILKRAKVLITDRASQSASPYKVNSTPALSQDKFKVLKIKAAIDKKATSIDERSTAVLKYRTPHFRAVASVEVPCLRDNQGVQIGWIQACTEMRFINSYGKHGMTSWEFPEIVSNKYTMIGDADGKQYPWYGSKLELQSVSGPTSSPTVTTIHMNDNFFPQVTWYIPHPDFDKTPRLTQIHRKQKFYTFLVAKCIQSGAYHVLKTIEWSMELNIEVNPSIPLGKRATLCEPVEQTQPVILDYNSIKLQPYALQPPNANNAQTLIWRPRASDEPPRMIVPPVETSMDMERYLASTRHLALVVPLPRMPRNPHHVTSGSQSGSAATGSSSTHPQLV